MSIVSSSYVLGNAFPDGRRFVTELHTDSVGVVHLQEYFAAADADYAAILAARVAMIEHQLAEAEAAQVIA
jgi:hypothetical protein